MTITSSTALRTDYASVSAIAHGQLDPVYITKNGEGDLVVMSIEAFERLEETFKLKAKLAAIEELRLSGMKCFSIQESRAKLEEIYG